ncbi:MAG: TIGR00730 family Rossman fold protein [Pseudomonadota bacterium]
MPILTSICVYCGSQPGNNPNYVTAARSLGKYMAQSGTRLVYGGGSRGIMGAVSASVLEHGGQVTGIIPKFLLSHEGVWQQETENLETVITDNMHDRKQQMFEKSDAFLALPGGIGTLEEIIEIMTWAQLERHSKPIAFLNIGDFWKPLFDMLDHMSSDGFLHTQHLLKPIIVQEAKDAVEMISNAIEKPQNPSA